MTRWNNVEYGIMPAMGDCEGCGKHEPRDNLEDGVCPRCRGDV